MKYSHKLIGLAALGLATSMPTTAFAQFTVGSNAPTTISADNADYQGAKTILTGGVDVRQGEVRILADKMTVFTDGRGNIAEGSFSRIVAEGNFYYLTRDQSVRGRKGIYTQATDMFEVTGDVILRQPDGNVVTGDKLFYNLKTENARVVGTCKGRKCGKTGRVNILIKNANSARPNS